MPLVEWNCFEFNRKFFWYEIYVKSSKNDCYSVVHIKVINWVDESRSPSGTENNYDFFDEILYFLLGNYIKIYTLREFILYG